MMNFAEFFAGVGLVHEGLSKDGWFCTWANDISHEKRETYVANFNNTKFYLGDIWEIINNSQAVPDDCFLYTASFPCTDTSLAGERKGLAGESSGSIHALLNIIENKKNNGNHPYLIMLENVQGFLTSHSGADISVTVKKLNELGYVIDLIELDAIYFTPQSRPRVFLFAVRTEVAETIMHIKNKNNLLDSWWAIFEKNPKLRTEKIKNIVKINSDLNWGALNIPAPPKRTSNLKDIIEKEIGNEQHYWWTNERKNSLFSKMSDLHKIKLEKMIANNELSYGTVYRRTRNKTQFAELRTDGIAGCLRTPKGGSSKQILICAGFGDWSVRLLTPREYARLQGVGDHFILPKNQNQSYFAMGDAVCVPVIEFISSHILTPAYCKIMGIPTLKNVVTERQ